MKKDKYREVWLRSAYAILRKELLPEAPGSCGISWIFPSRGGASRQRRTIGQGFGGSHIGGKVEGDRVVLVSPAIADELTILDTLLHEMIHAALPVGTGHQTPFSQLAKRCGLQKPWTHTTRSKELEEKLKSYLKQLPPWPGGHLIVKPKEAGKQLKAVCECKPPRILRLRARLLPRAAFSVNSVKQNSNWSYKRPVLGRGWEMPRHRHEWLPLYRKPPEDSEPKVAYCGDTLGDYLVCAKSSRVARRFRDPEELKILPPRQAAAHGDRATRWNAEMPETIH